MRVLYSGLCLIIFIVAASLCDAGPSRVLVVENTSSPDSIAIARYYITKRHIPASNVCRINCSVAEECSTSDGVRTILTPVSQYIDIHDLSIDYIVLTKGIPIRFNDGYWNSCSIDSVMVELDDPVGVGQPNPYYAATDKFSHSVYGIYLVTRLTGWTLTDCYRLIDSGSANRPTDGPIYLHPAFNKDYGGYFPINQSIRDCGAVLSNRGLNVDLDQSLVFHKRGAPMMGYYTWGSNDPAFDKPMYQSLRFAPGSIAETVVSTSGRTFDFRNAPGQSLIADLIHEGIAGCKGYVSEPDSSAMARCELLFDHYTSGWDLADSFYASSRYIGWKDIVIGDPLCAPYAHGNRAN